MIKFGDIEKDHYHIRIYPNTENEFEYINILNGLYLRNGGSNLDYIINKIILGLKQKLSKKLPKIKPTDIKNSIKIILISTFFPNPLFDTQTKERLINSQQEVVQFYKNLDFNKLINQIYKDKEFIDNIIENYKLKEKIEEIKTAKKIKKSKSYKSSNYIPAIKHKKYIALTEGLSALGFLSKLFGRKEFGYIAMTGVPMNIWQEKITTIANSKKFIDIQNVLGIDYVNKVANCDYEYVIIASDQDAAGFHIRALILAYFYKFAKNLFNENRIKILQTPLILVFEKNKLYKWFYNFNEYKEFIKNNDISKYRFEYNKGLGSSDKEIMEYIIEKDGLDKLLIDIKEDEKTMELFNLWFNKENANDRKEIVKQFPFNINML